MVWAQWVPGSGDIVFAAMRPVGGPWGAAEQVNISSGTLWAADVALDDWGRAYAIWVDRIGWPGVSHVYAASRPAGGAWGAPEAVRDSTVGNAFSSRVAVDSAGNVHAVWQDDRGGSGSDIYAAYRPAGGPWSANVRVNDVAGKASQPALGLDGAGNIVAAWEDYRPGAQGVYTAVRPRGSGWGTNELLIPAPAAAAGKVRPAPGGILDPTQTTWSAGFNLGGNGNFFDYSYYYQAPNDPNDPNSPYNVYQGGLPGAGASGDCHRTATTAQAAAQSPAQGGGGDPCHGGNAGEEPPLNADPASVFSIQTMAEILQEVAAIEAWVDEHVPSFFPSLPSAPEFWLPDSDIPQPTQPSANLPPGSDQTPFYPVGEYYDVDYDLSFIRPPEETANAPSSSNDSSSSALDSEPTSPAFNRVTQTDVPTDVRSADDPNLHTQPQISAPEGPTTAELAEFFIRWTFSSPEPRWEPPDAVTMDLPDIADPVLPHSGEFVHTETPLRIPGRGLDYSLDLTYRSQLVYDGPVGWGWTHNYDQHIRPIGGGSLARQVSGGLTDIFSFDGANFAPATGRFTTIVSNTTGITLTERGGMVETYFPLDDATAPGALRSISERNGNALTFAYDSQGRLQTATDTLGRPITYTYASATLSTGDANGRLTAVTDFSGRQVKLAYNAYGNLVGITTPAVTGTPSGNDFPSGKITRFAYTSGFADQRLNHNLTTIISPDEVADGSLVPRTVNTYGTSGLDFDRVVEQSWGGGRSNASGVPAGGVVTLAYSTAITPDDPPGAVSKTTITDRGGNVIELWHDGAGHRLRSRQDLTGLRDLSGLSFVTTDTAYNADGLLTSITYPAGNRIEYTYDTGAADRLAQGNLLEMRRVADITRGCDGAGATPCPGLVTTYTYEPAFQLLQSVTDPEGNTSTNTYDARGNLVRVDFPAVTVSPAAPQTAFETWTYNTHGQPLTFTDPEGNVTAYAYYASGPAAGYRQSVTLANGDLDHYCEVGSCRSKSYFCEVWQQAEDAFDSGDYWTARDLCTVANKQAGARVEGPPRREGPLGPRSASFELHSHEADLAAPILGASVVTHILGPAALQVSGVLGMSHCRLGGVVVPGTLGGKQRKLPGPRPQQRRRRAQHDAVAIGLGVDNQPRAGLLRPLQ